MIVLDKVTKFFKTNNGKKYILKNVSMTIPEGINVGILGINGAGKSTFLRILGGIDFPNSGKVISNKTFSWPMGLGGGFQGSMTGRQNVRFVARIFGKNKREINKIIDFVKDFSELGDYFDMPIKTYSSGMRSRLSFSLSLAFDFDYLLIDETLSVGDSRFKEKSKQALLKKIEYSNVLMVSHSMADLKKICDIGIVLHEGKIEFYDKINNAIERYQEINLLYGLKEDEIKDLFFYKRNKFDEVVKNAYLIEEQGIFKLIFFIKFLNKYVLFYLNDEEFFCKKINSAIEECCVNLQNKRSIEEEQKLIRHLISFLKRFKTKIYLESDSENNEFILSKRKKFFINILKNHKFVFLTEEEKNKILKKIKKMEQL